MVNPASLEFKTGVEDLDIALRDAAPFRNIFNYMVETYLMRKAAEEGQVAVMPTHITVAPFHDLDQNLSYDITSAVDLEKGRMISDEFKLTQRWLGEDSYRTFGIVDADNRVLIDNVGKAYLGSLVLLSGMYTAAYHPDLRGTR